VIIHADWSHNFLRKQFQSAVAGHSCKDHGDRSTDDARDPTLSLDS
jgi:hypothetical protein